MENNYIEVAANDIIKFKQHHNSFKAFTTIRSDLHRKPAAVWILIQFPEFEVPWHIFPEFDYSLEMSDILMKHYIDFDKLQLAGSETYADHINFHYNIY